MNQSVLQTLQRNLVHMYKRFIWYIRLIFFYSLKLTNLLLLLLTPPPPSLRKLHAPCILTSLILTPSLHACNFLLLTFCPSASYSNSEGEHYLKLFIVWNEWISSSLLWSHTVAPPHYHPYIYILSHTHTYCHIYSFQCHAFYWRVPLTSLTTHHRVRASWENFAQRVCWAGALAFPQPS